MLNHAQLIAPEARDTRTQHADTVASLLLYCSRARRDLGGNPSLGKQYMRGLPLTSVNSVVSLLREISPRLEASIKFCALIFNRSSMKL